MIPSTSEIFSAEIEYKKQTDNTYKLTQKETISGYIDNIAAVKQSVECILNTERYQYLIYSWDIGIELQDLLGEDSDYICAMLPNRIEEALMMDNRIKAVKNFEFEVADDVITAFFEVETIYGNFDEEVTVNNAV